MVENDAIQNGRTSLPKANLVKRNDARADTVVPELSPVSNPGGGCWYQKDKQFPETDSLANAGVNNNKKTQKSDAWLTKETKKQKNKVLANLVNIGKEKWV